MSSSDKQPPFIVLEGLDGAGTTTQASRLAARLGAAGQPVVLTREPSDGPIGVLIRQMLSMRVVTPTADGNVQAVGREPLALLFAADRLDHVAAEIEPGLAAGRVVISDRYLHSSLAYQGTRDAEGDDDETRATDELQWVRTLNSRARVPDITFFLQATVELCLSRLDSRGRRDIYETREKLERLVVSYDRVMTLLEQEGQTIVRLDAARPIDELSDEIYRHVAGPLNL